jgi:hypothetical protein
VQSAGVPDIATNVELSSQSLIEVATKFGAGKDDPDGTAPAESFSQGLSVTGLLNWAEPASRVAEGAGGGNTVMVIVEYAF